MRRKKTQKDRFMSNAVSEYEWEASDPQSCGYIAPEVL
jgi:hypothetical protein